MSAKFESVFRIGFNTGTNKVALNYEPELKCKKKNKTMANFR